MKVPTLRNVDKRPSSSFVKALGHNGYFKSLEDIVRVYAMRCMTLAPGAHPPALRAGASVSWPLRAVPGSAGVCGAAFPEPEVNQNLATLNPFRCRDQS
jgi:cytochrome c peroxidase